MKANQDRTTRTERFVEQMRELRREVVKLYMWGLVAGRASKFIFTQPRLCEQEAVNISMYYPQADAKWRRALVARAADVAKSRTPASHEHHTALMILRDLHYRTIKDGILPPFGTPEEMIPA